MSIVNLYFKIEAYDDASSVVVPILKEFDWTREINAISSVGIDTITRSCLGITTINLPSAIINMLYIEADRSIFIRLNGDTGSNNVLAPSVSGTMDAVYFKRGAVTSLTIVNPNGTDVAVDYTTDFISFSSHGFNNDDPVYFNAATMPGSLSANVVYYVKNKTANTFQVAATLTGSVVDITSNGSNVVCGTALIYPANIKVFAAI